MTANKAISILKNTAWLGVDEDLEKVWNALATLEAFVKGINVLTNDTISRQVAIDGIDVHYIERITLNDWQAGWNAALDWVKEVYLDELPSAQPDLQPPCNQLAIDCISRQAAINAIENTDCELIQSAWDEITDAIMRLPSVTPVTCVDAISRDAAIKMLYDLVKTNAIDNEIGIWFEFDTIEMMLHKLPSVTPDTSFISWLLDEIWDEDMWELNWQAFPEVVCRKLLKMGYLKEKDGEYERLD